MPQTKGIISGVIIMVVVVRQSLSSATAVVSITIATMV
jgi:hypothetical protein